MMAATEYARGHNISTPIVPSEITYFSLAKEFGWLPSQVQNEPYKNIRGIMQVLSIFNEIKNKEIEQTNRKSKR
jgi:hypothetical protein